MWQEIDICGVREKGVGVTLAIELGIQMTIGSNCIQSIVANIIWAKSTDLSHYSAGLLQFWVEGFFFTFSWNLWLIMNMKIKGNQWGKPTQGLSRILLSSCRSCVGRPANKLRLHVAPLRSAWILFTKLLTVVE